MHFLGWHVIYWWFREIWGNLGEWGTSLFSLGAPLPTPMAQKWFLHVCPHGALVELCLLDRDQERLEVYYAAINCMTDFRTPEESPAWVRHIHELCGVGYVGAWLWSVEYWHKGPSYVCPRPCIFCVTCTVHVDDQSRNDSEVGRRSVKPMTQGCVHGRECIPHISDIDAPSPWVRESVIRLIGA